MVTPKAIPMVKVELPSGELGVELGEELEVSVITLAWENPASS